MLERIGYHVRDYYLKQMERFAEVPRAVLAISTYLKGAGAFEHGVETARIRVVLATGISRAMCERSGLGYADPARLDLRDWQDRESKGILFVPRGGETLYLPIKGQKV